MSEVKAYICPNCGGVVVFDSDSQKMKCQYCDSVFDVEVFEEASEPQTASKDEQVFVIYQCQSCGGEIIADKTTGATGCPFCGNAVVLTDKFANDFKPDYVIPFKLDKKDAKEGLKRHLENKKLLPDLFKDDHQIDEIKGVYVPFWLFDTDVEAKARFITTRNRVYTQRDYTVIETSRYEVLKEGNLSFEKVPVDASSKVNKSLMDSLEPFDVNQAVSFETAYLAGYLADRYDISQTECEESMENRILTSVRQAFDRTVRGYDSVTLENCDVSHQVKTAYYVLYPVWLLNTTWQNQKFSFAMNGQTGKFVGDLPYDKAKYMRGLGLYTTIFSLVIFALMILGLGVIR